LTSSCSRGSSAKEPKRISLLLEECGRIASFIEKERVEYASVYDSYSSCSEEEGEHLYAPVDDGDMFKWKVGQAGKKAQAAKNGGEGKLNNGAEAKK